MLSAALSKVPYQYWFMNSILSAAKWQGSGLPGSSVSKESAAKQETQEMQVQSLDWEDALEKEITTHSSIFAWEIPWKEEPEVPEITEESDMV